MPLPSPTDPNAMAQQLSPANQAALKTPYQFGNTSFTQDQLNSFAAANPGGTATSQSIAKYAAADGATADQVSKAMNAAYGTNLNNGDVSGYVSSNNGTGGILDGYGIGTGGIITAPAPTVKPTNNTTPPAPTPTTPTGPTAPVAQQASIPQDKTVAGQVQGIINANSPLMQQAAATANQQANDRGLGNSSIAVGSAQNAVLSAATPIAVQDANNYSNLQGQNMQSANSLAGTVYQGGVSMANQQSSNATSIANTSATLASQAAIAAKNNITQLTASGMQYQAALAQTAAQYEAQINQNNAITDKKGAIDAMLAAIGAGSSSVSATANSVGANSATLQFGNGATTTTPTAPANGASVPTANANGATSVAAGTNGFPAAGTDQQTILDAGNRSYQYSSANNVWTLVQNNFGG